MATILERIQAHSTNENLTPVEKIERLSKVKFSKRNTEAHTAMFEALFNIVSDLRYRGSREIDLPNKEAKNQAVYAILDIAKDNDDTLEAAITTLQRIKESHEKHAPVYLREKEYETLRAIMTLADGSNKPGIAVFAARAMAETVPYSYRDSIREINNLNTAVEDVPGIIDVLEGLAGDFKEDHEKSTHRDLQFSRHHSAVQAISNIAKAGRHPELVNTVLTALERIGTDSAAMATADLMQNHYHYSIHERPTGKRGNLQHHIRPEHVQLNQQGFRTLVAIGDKAVPAIDRLPATKESINSLAEINTPNALKTIATIAHAHPDLEDHAVDTLEKIKTPLAAQALVYFGAANRHGVSEAFSARANVAFRAIEDMHWNLRTFNNENDGNTAKLKGLTEAATQLAAAITSESCLKNRFMTGKRTQSTIGRNTSRMIGLVSEPLIKAEEQRFPGKRKRKHVKDEVRNLKRMFKDAMKSGLLSKKDPSLQTLDAFDRYDKAQRQRAKFLASHKLS